MVVQQNVANNSCSDLWHNLTAHPATINPCRGSLTTIFSELFICFSWEVSGYVKEILKNHEQHSNNLQFITKTIKY